MNPDHAFVFADGTRAVTIKQLRDKLHSAPEETVAYHVSPTKSDFASWVRHVHHNDQLANDLEQVSTVRETTEVLTAFLEPQVSSEPEHELTSEPEFKTVQPVKHSPPPMPEHKVAEPEPENKEPPVEHIQPDVPEISKPASVPPPSMSEKPKSNPFVPPAGPIPKAPEREMAPPKRPVPQGLELPKHKSASQHHGIYEEFSFREFLIGFFLGALAGIALSLLLGGLF